MIQNIVAPQDRAVHVTVYEPRQHQDDEEIVHDQFDLGPGEAREYRFPTATAAYRTDPTTFSRPEWETRSVRADDNDTVDGKRDPMVNMEIEAGRKRVQENANRQKEIDAARAREERVAQRQAPANTTEASTVAAQAQDASAAANAAANARQKENDERAAREAEKEAEALRLMNEQTRLEAEKAAQEETVRRGPGRPPGSKNKA